MSVDGRRVLVLIPDGTRTMPMPMMFDILERELGPRVASLDYLVALGTHTPMTDAQLSAHVGRTVVNGVTVGADLKVGPYEYRIFNHRWDDPSSFVTLGTIPASDIAAITDGKLSPGCAGRVESARHRVRSHPHLRPCVSARSGRIFGRRQVPVPRDRGTATSSISRTGSAR